MSDPKNHHWIPQFLMRPWCGDDGRVTSFFMINNKITHRRKSTKQLGSQYCLYSITEANGHDKYLIEREIFGKIDDNASKIHQKMLTSGCDALTSLEKTNFSEFICLLNARKPGVIEKQRDVSIKWLREYVLSYLEVKTKVSDGCIQITDADFIVYGEYLNYMSMLKSASGGCAKDMASLDWVVMDGFDLDLVLSDTPLILRGLGNHIERFLLPLSPKHVLVAGRREYMLSSSEFIPELREAFAVSIIGDQFRNANKFVISKDLGRNSGLLSLAEAYLGKGGEVISMY